MEVNIGQEELIFESGSFTHFGIQTLNQVISSPSSPGLFMSLPLDFKCQIYLLDLSVHNFTVEYFNQLNLLVIFMVKSLTSLSL